MVYSREIIDAVWAKAEVVPGCDPREFRKDSCGAWIRRTYFGCGGKCSMGWSIDVIKPELGEEPVNLDNLQPLQWENFLAKKQDYPNWSAKVSSFRDENQYLFFRERAG